MKRRDAIARMALTMGGILSAGTLATVLEGCKSGSSSVATGVSFSPEQSAMIAEIADIILPRTQTPGAIDAKVPEFIQMMLKDCYKEDQQKAFFEGLTKLDEDAKKANNTEFSKSTPAQKLALIKVEDSAKERSEFWKTMKDLTILGYFTSEPGATKALEFLEVPGKDEAIKLEKGQKAWAMS